MGCDNRGRVSMGLGNQRSISLLEAKGANFMNTLTLEDHKDALLRIEQSYYRLETGEQIADALAKYEYHLKEIEKLEQ